MTKEENDREKLKNLRVSIQQHFEDCAMLFQQLPEAEHDYYAGKILDGRNRWLACRSADVEPVFREYEGDQPVQYVLSMNLRRRHLTISQRATVAADLANLKREDTLIQNRTDARKQATVQISQQAAADMVGVSRTTVQDAVALRKSDDLLYRQVQAGKLTLKGADRRAHPQKYKRHAALVASMKTQEAAAKESEAETETAKRTLAECEQVIFDGLQKMQEEFSELPPEGFKDLVRVDHHPHWPRGPGTIRGETEELLEELRKKQLEKWRVPEVEINAYIRSWISSQAYE
jgi:hypothetical protein